MPDGVFIPGGPSFSGQPQPPDVPCDPTGEGWRGPPGPQGPPGVGFDEAPADGTSYGRVGSTQSWNPVLPLSGGTLTGQLILPNGTTAAPALNVGPADGTGFSRNGNVLIASVQGTMINASFGAGLASTQYYVNLSMLNNRITQLGDATAAGDALNQRSGDARYTLASGGPFLPIAGGTLTAPAASTVPLLTMLTSDNGPTCNNGLEIIQGYNGGNLAYDHGLTPHTASVRFGTQTFHDHFAVVFNTANRATGQYNNLESVLTIPASPLSANLTNAFTASVYDYGGNGALAATLYAMAGVSNSTIYALNTVCTDRNGTNPYPIPLTNVREQVELDYFVSDPSTTVRGVLCDLSATDSNGLPVVQASGVSWIGFATALFPNSAPWSISYSSGNGSSRMALLVGTLLTGPTSLGNISQPVQFYYTDNTTATAQRAAVLSADPTFAGANGVDFRLSSSYGGKANLTLDNLAYFKAMNAAGTATLQLMGLTGTNQLSIGSGTSATVINSTNGVCADFVPVNASAINRVRIMGNATGLPVQIIAVGGDANVGLTVSTAGTGTLALQTNASPTTVGGTLRVSGNSGFNNTAPIARPTVTGAKGSNAALASLMTALAAYGLVTDSTTA